MKSTIPTHRYACSIAAMHLPSETVLLIAAAQRVQTKVEFADHKCACGWFI